MPARVVRVAVGLVCLLAGGCGGVSPPADSPAPELPAVGRMPDATRYQVTLDSTLESSGAGRRTATDWCPRVDLRYASGRRTHGAVGCRALRAHVPTGGYVMACRSSEIFILLLSTRSASSVAVEDRPGHTVALTRHLASGLDGRFWLGLYPGRTSPLAVISTEGSTRYLQRYPGASCLGSSAFNGLLGR